MSQERIQSGGDRAVISGGLGLSTSSNLSDVLSRSTKAVEKVRVVHGANEQYFDNLSGKKVEGVRRQLRDVFNIPSDADAIVDGKVVTEDFVLAAGQNLEFSKAAGTKGAR